MVYKSVKFKLSSWRKLRGAVKGLPDESFSDYIERIAKGVKMAQLDDCWQDWMSPTREE